MQNLTKYTQTSPATSISCGRIADKRLPVSGVEDCDPIRCCPNEYKHFVPFRTSGERPALFCFFPGPPGSSEFVDILPEDQPIYDFYFSRLRLFGANFPNVDQLAITFLRELREIQPHGPYQLCGYSKAGLVAYEIARLLLSEGENVSFLALFETWHPGYEKHLTGRELLRFRFLHLTERLQRYGRNLIQGKFSDLAAIVWKAISKRVKLLGWRATRMVFQTAGQPIPEGLQGVEAIVVLKSFVPKPYPKRFMLIRMDDPFESKLKDQTLGWHVCATEGVDVHFVPGDQNHDHGTMMNKPYVHGVMDRITPYLAGPNGP